MDSSRFLARRPVCHTPRPHPPLLRTEHLSAAALKNWISFWKNYVTRGWQNHGEVPIWQTEYWDRQLRRGESYDEKWRYVENNPARHGYVTVADHWPYRGELNILQWHD